MDRPAGTTQPGGNPQRQAGNAQCRLSQTPSTDLTGLQSPRLDSAWAEVSPAAPEPDSDSRCSCFVLPCCAGLRPRTSACIHATSPSSRASVGGHQLKQWAQTCLGSPVPAARVPLSGLLSGCSSGTHNPLLCMLSPLGYLGSFPRRRKFRLEQNNSKHRCGHTCLQCPGLCPPAPTGCATQGQRGIAQAASRPGWQQDAWKQAVMEGHYSFAPRYGTACHKRECPELLGTPQTPGHGGQAWALQRGAQMGRNPCLLAPPLAPHLSRAD